MRIPNVIWIHFRCYSCGTKGRWQAYCSEFQVSLRNLGTIPFLSDGYFLPAISLAKFTKNFKYQWPFNTPSQGFRRLSMSKKVAHSLQCLCIHIIRESLVTHQAYLRVGVHHVHHPPGNYSFLQFHQHSPWILLF